DHLGGAPAAVVADQDDLVKVKSLEEVGDQPAESGGGQVGVGPHRSWMGAEGQLGGDAAELPVQAPDDRIPEVGAHEVAVEEHDRGAAAGLVVAQGAVREVDGGHRVRLQVDGTGPKRSASREIEVAVAIGVLATIGPREAADVTRWWDAEWDFARPRDGDPLDALGNGPVVLRQQAQLAGSGDGLGAGFLAGVVRGG